MSIQKRFKKPVAISPVVLPENARRLLTVKAAAQYLSMSVDVIRDLIRKREVPYIPNGRRYLLDPADLDRHIEKIKVGIAA